jgi:hypothetical protein
MNRRVGGYVFALIVGLLVAFLSYRWITDPAPRFERELQERAVLTARAHLRAAVAGGDLEIVDPLAPKRKVGKVYIYRSGDGWEISGYYRRDEEDGWHPFLMSLDETREMVGLKIKDPRLVEAAASDSRLDVSP